MIINEKLKFKFEEPKGYYEISHSDYGKYGIDETTVYCFLSRDGASMTICQDIDASSKEEYEKIVSDNIACMKKVGMKVVEKNQYKNKHGLICDEIKLSFEHMNIISLFILINKTVLACSVLTNGKEEKDLKELFDTFEEIK